MKVPRTKGLTSAEIDRAAKRTLDRILTRILSAHPELPKRVGITRGIESRDVSLQVDFEVVGSARMRKLNAAYRGLDKDTDVLSFPSPAVFRKLGRLGDLVVSRPRLHRQAREVGHAPRTELKILLVHGVLHLLDFDHEAGPVAARAMERWERRLLVELGVETGLIRRSRARA